MVEQSLRKAQVVGSIPASGTTDNDDIHVPCGNGVWMYCRHCGFEAGMNVFGPNGCAQCGRRLNYVVWNSGEEKAAERLIRATRRELSAGHYKIGVP